MSACSVDLLVIGGGPAGAVAALVLARRGWRVAIACRPSRRSPRIVETLPAPSRFTLKSLGLWAGFIDAGPLPAVGTVSWWDTAAAIEYDAIVNPFGNGWQVDRRRFDRLIRAAAVEAGAELLPIERLLDAAIEGAAGSRDRWRVRTSASAHVRDIRARFLVNATGRMASFRPGDCRRISIDRLVGLAAVFEASTMDVDQRLWIEATPSGWWYSAPGTDGRWTAVFFTDVDLYESSVRRDLANRWVLALAEGPRTAQRLAVLGCPAPGLSLGLHVLGANSYITTRCQGDGWLAAGDASAAVDPLSGQGIERALNAGIRAAETVDEVLGAEMQGDAVRKQAAFDDYQQRQTAIDREYLSQRRECYARVRRWTDRPFWQRRSPGENTNLATE